MLPIYYTSDESGSPTLNNAAGSLISVLDACLINGWGLKSVTSITVASGVATVVCTGHQFSGGIGRKVLIAGATPSALNGSQDVTVVDANTFTFLTTAANGTATGTITAKRAPLGWSKLYSGTNKAIYQRTDAQATSMLLRVDDTNTGNASATYARVVMVESATDVDTYTNASPTTAQLAGGLYVSKGANSTTAKKWMLVGDVRTLYIFTDGASYPWTSNYGLKPVMFGDINSYRSGGDAYGCMISGLIQANDTSYTLYHEPSSTSSFMARAANHITPSDTINLSTRSTGSSLIGGAGPAYPSDVDGGCTLDLSPLVRSGAASTSGTVRGAMRGLVTPFANMSSVAITLHGSLLTSVVGTSNTLLCVGHGDQHKNGVVMFNVSSEW